MHRALARTMAGLGVTAVAGGVFHELVAPRLETWGATVPEAHEHLPGDELIAGPATTSTCAIGIDAPGEAVWRWLVQIGTDRGGWYTYDWLERIAGVPVTNTEEVRDEWQVLEVGDRVCLAPAGWMGNARGMLLPVVDLVQNERIVLRQAPPDSPWDGVWSFHLRPEGSEGCRLIIHSRTAQPRSGAGRVAAIAGSFVTDVVTFVMERGMLRGIKRRAEAERDSAGGRSGPAAPVLTSL